MIYFRRSHASRKPRQPNVLLGLCVNSMHEPVCVGRASGLIVCSYKLLQVVCTGAIYGELDWRKWLRKGLRETSSSACVKSKLSAAVARILT